MRRYGLIFVFILLSTQYPIFAENYFIEMKGRKISGNYYEPLKRFEVRRSLDDTYSKNSFFIKPANYLSEYDINKILSHYLAEGGFVDLKIVDIETPFSKFFSNNLLSKSHNTIENIYRIKISVKYDIFDICKILNEVPDFEYVVPEYFYKISEYIPNDPEIQRQWALEKLKLFDAWSVSRGNGSKLIAIVDSGTDYLHEDLFSQLWTNPNEIPDDGIDNDGNGFIDDVYGWDFVGDINHTEAVNGQFKEDNDVIPKFTSNDHGTHVAGLAAANSDNSIGIASTGFNVRFLPVKIGVDNLTLSRNVYRPYEALLYAASLGADVVNCSWSSRIHDPLAEDVVSEIISRGTTIVAAAGNESFWTDYYPYYPSQLNGVISVGSVSDSDRLSNFSNYGVNISCFAPGVSILSTINGDKYSGKSGTSMSSPLVAGIAANIKQIFPNFSPLQIAKQIRATGDKNISTSQDYSQVNALNAFRNNNPAYTQYKNQGLGIENIFIDKSDAIRSYGVTKIKLLIRNYLSDSKHFKLILSANDNYFQINPPIIDFEPMNSNELKEIEVEFILQENCPWFDGRAYIMASFESEDYLEKELHHIPVKLESSNRFLLANIFMEDVDLGWYDAETAGNFDFWSVGYDFASKKGALYNFGKLNRLSSPSNDTLVAVSAFNDRILSVAANGRNSDVSILNSTNSGATFEKLDVSPMFKNIRGLKRYSIDDIIVYGLGHQDFGEIYYSTDGGKSYMKSSSNYQMKSNEIFTSKLVAKNGFSYLGTNFGTILSSNDNGKKWVLYSNKPDFQVQFIAPLNHDTLFVLNKFSEYRSIYFITDQGQNFERIFPLNLNLDNVISVFVPDSSSGLYLFSEYGKLYYTIDFGKSWEPELSYHYKFHKIHTAKLFQNGMKGRIWMPGIDINYLDFDIQPLNIIKDVRIAGKTEIDFDTVYINKFSEEIIFLQNFGNSRADILSQKLAIGTEFELSKPFKSIISAGELISADIKYKPETTGLHSDTLFITTTAGYDTLKFALKGISVDPASVLELNGIESLKLINSTNERIIFTLSGNYNSAVSFKLFDLNGRIIIDYGTFSNNYDGSLIELSLNNISSGVYLLKAISGEQSGTYKIIIY